MRGPLRLFAGVLAGMALAVPAHGTEWHSSYQDLTPRACPDPTPGRALRAGDHATTVMRCPPVAGFRLQVTFHPHAHEVQISDRQRTLGTLAFLSGLGPKAEWRGPKRGSSIDVRALIIRLGAADLADEKAALLAVMKVSPEAVCLMGVVDIRSNPEANGRARAEADQRADAFNCASDAALVFGHSTAFAEAFVDRLR